jgi:ribosomal protein S18 acetylase RimI-like enzyme
MGSAEHTNEQFSGSRCAEFLFRREIFERGGFLEDPCSSRLIDQPLPVPRVYVQIAMIRDIRHREQNNDVLCFVVITKPQTNQRLQFRSSFLNSHPPTNLRRIPSCLRPDNMMRHKNPASTIQRAKESYQKNPSTSKSLKNGGEWDTSPDFDDLRTCLGKSFAGNAEVPGEPVMTWAATQLLKQEWYTTEEHEKAFCFGLGFPIYEVLHKDSLIVCQRMNREDRLASAAIILEYDPTKKECIIDRIVGGWRFLRAFMKIIKSTPVPALYSDKSHRKDSEHLQKSIDYILSTFKKYHKSHGPQERHWYVMMVGVIPDYNGQGLGRALLEKINSLADERGVSMFLECGPAKVGFYEKMGFCASGSIELKDPVDPTKEPFVAWMMTRTPLPPKGT